MPKWANRESQIEPNPGLIVSNQTGRATLIVPETDHPVATEMDLMYHLLVTETDLIDHPIVTETLQMGHHIEKSRPDDGPPCSDRNRPNGRPTVTKIDSLGSGTTAKQRTTPRTGSPSRPSTTWAGSTSPSPSTTATRHGCSISNITKIIKIKDQICDLR